MPLSYKNWGTSAVYGLVDIAATYLDESQQRSFQNAFQNVRDVERLAAVGGGAALARFSRGSLSEVGEAVTISATPLLEKSLANFVLGLLGNPTRF